MSSSAEHHSANEIGPTDRADGGGVAGIQTVATAATSVATQLVHGPDKFITICSSVAINGYFSDGAGTASATSHPPFAAGVHYRMRIPRDCTHFNHIGSVGRIWFWRSSE